MQAAAQFRRQENFANAYKWSIVIIGNAALICALIVLPPPHLDLRFYLLAAAMILISSRLSVQIPRVNTNVTVSDVFIFLVLMLYGGLAGIAVATLEGLFSGLRITKNKRGWTRFRIVAFNAAMMTCSTALTVAIVQSSFGVITNLRSHGISTFVAAVLTIALVQYFGNSGICALGLAFITETPFWRTWHEHYLWTSMTYIAGAAIAAVVLSSVEKSGLTVLIVCVPAIFVVYFTYQKYLQEIKATAAHAEQAERDRAEAERARAEAERERAEQAERHVEELNRHIAEQERISAELQQSKDHFRRAAFHDALTHLPNRALLAENLKFVIERARQHEDYEFAVLFLDLDRFKNVNDSLGHSIGDQLLIAMARRLESCIRECDIVARLGGDEFAILLDGIANSGEVLSLARRIQEKLQSPFNLSGHEVFTTASIGITLSSAGYDDAENVLRDADTAMYRAKAQGKACYEVFDKGMHARAVYLLQMENDLRRALEREEFCVYYQPIVTLENGKLAGFEALIRWQHPDRGFINPVDFIPVAEETGMIVPIGMWVLRRACEQLRQWQFYSPANRSLFMSVNLSGKQLAQSSLVSDISKVLTETGIDAHHLKLEITESAMIQNADNAAELLKRLKQLGAQLSIDDFGTGYSSLGYLHRFPVDTIKIDQSFISRMGDATDDNGIVRAIMSLADNMGMHVVAEGVETLGQLGKLRNLKCDYGQGYLFSRPVDCDAVASWISREPEWLPIFFPATLNQFVVNATAVA
jgi:diguanylate cyclase (GGDEF)-like protein